MKHVGGVAAIAAGVVALAGCGVMPTAAQEDEPTSSSSSSSTTPTPEVPPIERAANACLTGHIVQDQGKSITLDTKGTGEGNAKIHDPIEGVSCLLGGLGAPEFVVDHINSTRALDGQQTDEWDHFEARWTYHPDDGLVITFIDRS